MEYLNKLLKRPKSTPPFETKSPQLFVSSAEGSCTSLPPPSVECPTSLSSSSSFQSLCSSKASSGICSDTTISALGRADHDSEKSYANPNITDVDDLISACAGLKLDSALSLDQTVPLEDESLPPIEERSSSYTEDRLLKPGREEEDTNSTNPNSNVSSQDLSIDQTFTSATEEQLLEDQRLDGIDLDESVKIIENLPNSQTIHDATQVFETCPNLLNVGCLRKSPNVTTGGDQTDQSIHLNFSGDEDEALSHKSSGESNFESPLRSPVKNEHQNGHGVEEDTENSSSDQHDPNLIRSIDSYVQSSSIELSSTGELPSIVENLTYLEQQQKISSPILDDTVELTSPIVLDREDLDFEVVENGVVGDVNSNLREIVKEEKNHLNNSIKNETSLSNSINNNNNCENLDVNLNNSRNKSLLNGNVSPNRTTDIQQSEKSFTEDSEKAQKLSSNNNFSNFEDFVPVQQSTELLLEEALSVSKNFENSSDRIEEDSEEQFVPITTETFRDPAALDLLASRGSNDSKNSRGKARFDSLYLQFDPLANRPTMLPQMIKNNAPETVGEEVEEEKDSKNEESIDEFKTPKKNPALAVIDKLLFYSPCTPGTDDDKEAKQKKEVAEKTDTPPIQVPVVNEEMAKELEFVRSTVVQLEAEIDKLKKEQSEKVSQFQIDKLNKQHSEKISQLQNQLSQAQTNLANEKAGREQMNNVIKEYEKSISRLIAEQEKEKAKLQEELQLSNQHLSNTEAAFSDVHSKYERLKSVVSAYKSNEEVLKQSIAENQETIKTLEARYEQLKSHAMAELEKANLELNAIKKQNDAETLKLKALVRKAELKSKSLEETVEQKTKENKELTQIIDEMIARVE